MLSLLSLSFIKIKLSFTVSLEGKVNAHVYMQEHKVIIAKCAHYLMYMLVYIIINIFSINILLNSQFVNGQI